MYNEECEQSIKAAIKRGDKNAFRLLYEKFYSGLCILAQRYVRQPDIAEDIVQKTFMRIWETRRETVIQGSLYCYLYSSVRNNSLNYLKHLLVERKYSADKARQLQKALNFIQLSQEDGSSILIAREMNDALNEAIKTLPEKCREIFILHRYDGMKYSEIAEKLDISQNTVQRQISIALEKLRAKLLHYLLS